MLNRFDRYIARTLIVSMVVIALCSIVLLVLFGLIDESRGSEETRSFVQILGIVFLNVPEQLGELVPYFIFLGSLVGLGSLSTHSEIVVLRAAGISPIRLFASASLAAMIVLLVSWFVTDYVGPKGVVIADKLNGGSSITTAPRGGYWYKEGDVFTQLADFDEQEFLQHVNQFEFDEKQRLIRARRAASGKKEAGIEGWVLQEVTETEFTDGHPHPTTKRTQNWDIRSDISSFKSRVSKDAEELSLVDLFHHIEYLKIEGQNPTEFQIRFWSRVITPLSVLGLVLISVGFVIGPLREVSMGLRITTGLGVGFAFGYLQNVLVPLAIIYAVPVAIAVLSPVVISWIVGLLLVRRLA